MSVIEFRELNGNLVPFENGMALASFRADDEAQQWVRNQGLMAPKVIILGLGAGVHVRQWIEANPECQVTVIDPRPALLQTFLAANEDIKEQIEILIIDSQVGLLQHEIMGRVAQEVPPVLLFKPAVGLWSDFFETAFATLTGRNIEGLKFFLQNYGFASDVTSESMANRRLLTIRDLGMVVDANHEGHPAASAVRVLRELVL